MNQVSGKLHSHRVKDMMNIGKKKKVGILLLLIFGFCLNACGTSVPAEEYDESDEPYPVGEDVGVEALVDNTSTEMTGTTQKPLPAENATAFEKLFSNAPHIAYDENYMAGYIDINGDYVIPPVYKSGRGFSERYAAVQDAETELWGYIDTEGNIVITPQYGNAYRFKDGIAIVSTESYDNFGAIDKSGAYIIDPIYREVSYFKEGYALVKDGDMYRYIDEVGNFAFDWYYDAYLFENVCAVVRGETGPWKILHSDGEYSFWDFFIDSFPSSEVYGDVSVKASRYISLSEDYIVEDIDGNYVMVNQSGEIISPAFEELGWFNGDYARAAEYVDGRKLYGFVDRNFNWVIEPQYEECNSLFVNGYTYAIKSYSTEDMIIDTGGNEYLTGDDFNGYRIEKAKMNYGNKSLPIPAYILEESEDGISVRSGYLDYDYNEVLPFDYDIVEAFASDGSYAIVKYHGLYGMIDLFGNWLIEPKFNSFDTYAH